MLITCTMSIKAMPNPQGPYSCPFASVMVSHSVREDNAGDGTPSSQGSLPPDKGTG